MVDRCTPQLYDSEAERFQEWVLSSSVFPAYVRRLYLAANPVLAHPLYDLYQQGDSSDEEGDRGGDDGQALSPEAKATAAFAAAQQGEWACPDAIKQQETAFGSAAPNPCFGGRTGPSMAAGHSVAGCTIMRRPHSMHRRAAAAARRLDCCT